MLSFECIKNEKSVYFLLTSAREAFLVSYWQLAPFQVLYCPIASLQKYFLALVGQFL